MARHFTAASGDYVDLAPGSSSTIDGGPSTVVMLWRPTTVHSGWLLHTDNGSGGTIFAINPYTDNTIWNTIGGTFHSTMGYTAGDDWRLDIWTKATGTTQLRGHRMLLSAGTWAHADYGTSANTTNIPSTRCRVGKHFSTSGALDGDVAAMAIVQAEWSDATIAAGSLETGLAQWMTIIGVDPAVVWSFGQTSVSDPVTDVTGGGGDQTAISGTSISTDPAGFSYLLSTPTDCVVSATLPMIVGSVTSSSLATCVMSATLPAVDAHLSIGASIPPPMMVGTATVLELLGSALVV